MWPRKPRYGPFLVFNYGQPCGIVTPQYPNIDWVANTHSKDGWQHRDSICQQTKESFAAPLLHVSSWVCLLQRASTIITWLYLEPSRILSPWHFSPRSGQTYVLNFNFLEFRVGLGTKLVAYCCQLVARHSGIHEPCDDCWVVPVFSWFLCP